MIIRTFATAAFVVAGILTASAAEPTTVSVLVEAGTIKYHEQIAAEYMKQNSDVAIEFRSPVSDYAELVRQALLASQTDTLPDIGFFGNNTLRTLVEREVALPLDDLIAAEKDWSSLGYDASMLRIARFDGRQFGIPFSTSLPVIFYNADLVRKAGGDPDKAPESWDELVTLAAKISALEEGTAGIYVRMEDTWNWQCMVYAAGGKMMSEDEASVLFDEEPGLAATRLLARFGAEGKMPSITWTQARQQFSAGRLGILVGSSSNTEGLVAGSGGRFEIKSFAYPGLGEKSRLPAGGNTGVILASDPTKRAAAWRYLKFVTGPQAQTIMVKATGYLPINRIAMEDNAFLGDFYAQRPLHAVALKEAQYAAERFAFPGENGLRADELIATTLLDVIYQRVEPDEALHQLADQTATMLKQQ